MVERPLRKDFPACERCRFWQKYNGSDHMGECRREPPVGKTQDVGAMQDVFRAKWPVTFHREWCAMFLAHSESTAEKERTS